MHPYFNIFGKVFPAYGVMCALGIILALILCMFRAVRARLCPMRTLIIFTFSLTFGMAGAVFTHLIVTYSPSEILLFLKNGFLESGYAPGFVFYGGLIAGFLGACLSARIFRISLSLYAPHLLPALPLAHAFGRVGCFFAGCCHGIESSFGFLHPNGKILFPVQLLEAGILLLITYALISAARKGHRHLLRLYALFYAPARFFLEFLRGDEIRGVFLLSTSQWISLLIVIISLMPVKSPRKG